MTGRPSQTILRSARMMFIASAVLAAVVAAILVRLVYARTGDVSFMNYAAGSRMVTERIARLADEGLAAPLSPNARVDLAASAAELRSRTATIGLAAAAPVSTFIDSTLTYAERGNDRAAGRAIVAQRAGVIVALEARLARENARLQATTQWTAIGVLVAYVLLIGGIFLIFRHFIGPLAHRLDASTRERSILAAAVEQATDMIFVGVANAAGDVRIAFANDAIHREFGYAPGELIGKTPAFMYGPRTSSETLDAIRAKIQDGSGANGEFTAYRRDGSSFWSEWRGRPVALDEGGSTRIAIGRNTDERRRHEDALAMLSAAVNSANDAIYVYSLGGDESEPILRYVNEAGSAQSGFRMVEPLPSLERIHPNLEPQLLGEILTSMQAGHSWHRRVRLLRPDGATYWADMNLKPLRDRAGKFSQWISIERDVSADVERERKVDDERRALAVLVDIEETFVQTVDAEALERNYHRALVHDQIAAQPEARRLLDRVFESASKNVSLYAELAAGRDALQASETLRKDVMLMIAHDIRGPLTGLLGFGELLAEGLIGEAEMPETVRAIVAAGRRLESLADELSLFARLEEGDYRPTYERIDVNALVADVCGYLPGAERVDIEPAGDGSLDADRIALRHLLENLISNALKYSPDASRVTVCLSRDATMLTFAVADRGIGIPERDLPNVFTRGARASNAAAIKGTGLGLSFVQRLVAASGGEIGVRSTVGVGSTFTVHLPLRGTSPGVVEALAFGEMPA